MSQALLSAQNDLAAARGRLTAALYLRVRAAIDVAESAVNTAVGRVAALSKPDEEVTAKREAEAGPNHFKKAAPIALERAMEQKAERTPSLKMPRAEVTTRRPVIRRRRGLGVSAVTLMAMAQRQAQSRGARRARPSPVFATASRSAVQRVIAPSARTAPKPAPAARDAKRFAA